MEASVVREEKEQGTEILLQDAKNLASGIAATCWLRAEGVGLASPSPQRAGGRVAVR
jgi:hypothetical protein